MASARKYLVEATRGQASSDRWGAAFSFLHRYADTGEAKKVRLHLHARTRTHAYACVNKLAVVNSNLSHEGLHAIIVSGIAWKIRRCSAYSIILSVTLLHVRGNP